MKEPFKPQRNIEGRFAGDILSLLTRYFALPEAERARLLGDTGWVAQYAWQAAQRMITGLAVTGHRDWRSAARESMHGAEIHAALKHELHGRMGRRMRELIASNSKLISSLPEEVALLTSQRIAREHIAGERASSYEEKLLGHLSRTKARLIARTETSKASTALTRARAEDLGLAWYVWETSSDARVRASHRLMQGVLVPWSTPPSPERLLGMKSEGNYNAGDIYNCRCYPAPLIDLRHVSWPHKVFTGNRIEKLSLVGFRKFANLQPLAA